MAQERPPEGPYGLSRPLSLEEDLAVHMPDEIDPEQVVTPLTDEDVAKLLDEYDQS